VQRTREYKNITDMVASFFHWVNPSFRVVFLGSTLPVIEMIIRDISLYGKSGPYIGLKNLPPTAENLLRLGFQD
jgi:hypothetical protein